LRVALGQHCLEPCWPSCLPALQAASSGYGWLNKDPLVLIAGFLGWFAPSNIAVPAFGNQSLFGAFTKSIGEELAHFPTGPALTDDFWWVAAVGKGVWWLGMADCRATRGQGQGHTCMRMSRAVWSRHPIS
jgi:photosystem I subunit PsaO